jgi:putative FmdB family regulatory protein
MPLYEYQCDACGHRFEKIQKFSDPLESICPVCGGVVRKLVSSPAIQFKGSGFYITDYPKKDQGGTDKSEGGAAEKATKSESTSSKDEKASKTEKAGRTEKGDKSTTPAASDKSASGASTSSSSGSKESSSASPSTTKSST